MKYVKYTILGLVAIISLNFAVSPVFALTVTGGYVSVPMTQNPSNPIQYCFNAENSYLLEPYEDGSGFYWGSGNYPSASSTPTIGNVFNFGSGTGGYDFFCGQDSQWFNMPSGSISDGKATIMLCGQNTLGFDDLKCIYGDFLVEDSVASFVGSTTPVTSGDTRILELLPVNGSTYATGSPITFSLTGYISPDDVGSWYSIKYQLSKIDHNRIDPDVWYEPYYFSVYATTSGQFTVATTTYLDNGNYSVKGAMRRSFVGGWIDNPLGILDIVETHQFVVGEETNLGRLSQELAEWNPFGSVTSTTTANSLRNNCVPWSGDFEIDGCLIYLLKPQWGELRSILDSAYAVAGHTFPLGYVTSIADIFWTTATTSLPVISAVIPSGIAGAGSSIELEINSHSMDWLWNATTTAFNNVSASSTETFYEITSYYTNLFAYFSFALYLLGRVLGSIFVPNFDPTAYRRSEKRVRFAESRRKYREALNYYKNNFNKK